MTTDTPRRSSHPGHTHSEWARQALSFTSSDTSRRNRTSNAAIAKAAFCIVLLLLALAGFSAFSRGRQPSHFGSHSLGSALEQLGQPAVNELRDCTLAKSPLCKWARRYNRANRKRPVDWEPAEGWPEDAEVLSSIRHTSDRALTAVEKGDKPPEALQNIVQSFWPVQPAPGVSDTPQSSLPQCGHLHNRPCIAIIGKSAAWGICLCLDAVISSFRMV